MNKIEQNRTTQIAWDLTMVEQSQIEETEINDSQSHRSVSNLNISQYQAIELILAGKSDAQVAEAVGKRRNTIWHWRNHHPQFIAALNQRQKQLHEESVMNNLCSQSLEVIEKTLCEVGQLNSPAVQLALAVLKASVSQISLPRLHGEPNQFAADNDSADKKTKAFNYEQQGSKRNTAIVTLYPQPPIS